MAGTPGFGSIGGGGGSYDLGDTSSAESRGYGGDIYTGAKSVSFGPKPDNKLLYGVGALALLYMVLKYKKVL